MNYIHMTNTFYNKAKKKVKHKTDINMNIFAETETKKQ